MRPAFGSNRYNMLQSLPTYANTSFVSPGVVRIPLSSVAQFVEGDPVIVHYTFKKSCYICNRFDRSYSSINRHLQCIEMEQLP